MVRPLQGVSGHLLMLRGSYKCIMEVIVMVIHSPMNWIEPLPAANAFLGICLVASDRNYFDRFGQQESMAFYTVKARGHEF